VVLDFYEEPLVLVLKKLGTQFGWTVLIIPFKIKTENLIACPKSINQTHFWFGSLVTGIETNPSNPLPKWVPTYTRLISFKNQSRTPYKGWEALDEKVSKHKTSFIWVSIIPGIYIYIYIYTCLTPAKGQSWTQYKAQALFTKVSKSTQPRPVEVHPQLNEL